jgi:hypothetical protein
MVSQIITPQKETVELEVTLPANYIGKKVYCFFYIEEEVENGKVSISSAKKPSDFFGILTPEEADKFDKHTRQIRNEWDRDIQP